MAEQQYNHNDIMNKLDFIHRDLGALNERTENTDEQVTQLGTRIHAVERKIWFMHGAWACVTAGLVFFKEKIMGLL